MKEKYKNAIIRRFLGFEVSTPPFPPYILKV